jgi:glutamine amidotransferase
MSGPSVTVVDYGVGNLFSVRRALEHCGGTVTFAATAAEVEAANRLLLPGVGAFADGMAGLRERGLVEAIQRFAQTHKPLLGICLGMQMLAGVSEEFGEHAGLGLISGRVVPIQRTGADGKPRKIPHVGWSSLTPPANADWRGTLLEGSAEGTAVYLVHSYRFLPDDSAQVLAHCDYGGHPIVCAVRAANITGCQFHPEKSGPAGLRMLNAFLRGGTA